MDRFNEISDFIKKLNIIDGYGNAVQFETWPCQNKFLDAVSKYKYVVVLKARQLGFTWTVAAYALHEILKNEYATVLYLSYKEEMGKDFLKKVKFLERTLPEELRIKGKKINRKTEFGSEETFSRIIALPSGENQGAGFSSVNLVIMDEWARHPHDEEVFQSIYPTLSNNKNGRLIGISTPEHAGNLFHEIWTKGKGYCKLAFDWREHPWRNQKWKQEQINRIGKKRFERQYELKFTYSGDPVFDLDNLNTAAQREDFYDSSAVYFVGVDTASGSQDGDFSAICILKYKNNAFTQVSSYAAREPISVFADKIIRAAGFYHASVVLVEENNTGYAVLERLYDNLPYDIITPFNTNSATKPLIISGLEEALRKNYVLLSCPKTRDELLAYSYDKRGGMNATKGMHDDRVIALALAYEARKYKSYNEGDVVAFL